MRNLIGLACAAALALLVVLGLRHGARPAAPVAPRADAGTPPRSAPRVRDFPKKPEAAPKIFDAGDGRDESAPPHPWAAYLGRLEGVREKLRAPGDLDSRDVTLKELVDQVAEAWGVDILLDPAALAAADKTVSFAVKHLAGHHVLKLLLQQYDLAWVLDAQGRIWIAAEADLARYAPAFYEDIRRLETIRSEAAALEREREESEVRGQVQLTLARLEMGTGFEDAPLTDIVATLQERSGLNFLIDRRLIEDPDGVRLTLGGATTKMAEGLEELARAAELGLRIEKGVVVLTSRAEAESRAAEEAARQAERDRLRAAETELWGREVGFGADNLPVREVARLLAQSLSVPVEIDPATWARPARLSFPAAIRTAGDVLALLQRAAPVRARLRDGRLWFLSADGR